MDSYISAGVTLLVGLIALEVYRRQKRDEKKNAARIILVEIENAERQLSIIKENNNGNISENPRLMTSSSWEKYRHLFGRDFTPREWDTISDFYNRCLQYDKAVEYDDSSFYHDIEAFRTSINNALALGALTIVTSDGGMTKEEISTEYGRIKDNLVGAYMDNLHMYSPNKPVNVAARALSELNSNLSLTSVGDKLRKLSKPSFWQKITS